MFDQDSIHEITQNTLTENSSLGDKPLWLHGRVQTEVFGK
jgi:hypothetical protein